MAFLPQDAPAVATVVAHIEQVVASEGLTMLGWREVPLDHTTSAEDAREVCPTIRQFFVGKGTADTPDRPALERKLYVVRKVFENTLEQTGISDDDADFLLPVQPELQHRGLQRPAGVSSGGTILPGPE